MRRVDLREMPAFAWGGGRCVYGDEKSTKAVHHLVSCQSDLLDLARNVAGFDDGLLTTPDLNLLRATLREWRDAARSAIAKTESE